MHSIQYHNTYVTLCAGCPPGYVQYDKGCYYANYLRSKNWTDAQTECSQYNWNLTGGLAEFDDLLQGFFLSNLATSKTYVYLKIIGLIFSMVYEKLTYLH